VLILVIFYPWAIKRASRMVKDKELAANRASLKEPSDWSEPSTV
jgi:hypothetical protein